MLLRLSPKRSFSFQQKLSTILIQYASRYSQKINKTTHQLQILDPQYIQQKILPCSDDLNNSPKDLWMKYKMTIERKKKKISHSSKNQLKKQTIFKKQLADQIIFQNKYKKDKCSALIQLNDQQYSPSNQNIQLRTMKLKQKIFKKDIQMNEVRKRAIKKRVNQSKSRKQNFTYDYKGEQIQVTGIEAGKMSPVINQCAFKIFQPTIKLTTKNKTNLNCSLNLLPIYHQNNDIESFNPLFSIQNFQPKVGVTIRLHNSVKKGFKNVNNISFLSKNQVKDQMDRSLRIQMKDYQNYIKGGNQLVPNKLTTTQIEQSKEATTIEIKTTTSKLNKLKKSIKEHVKISDKYNSLFENINNLYEQTQETTKKTLLINPIKIIKKGINKNKSVIK